MASVAEPFDADLGGALLEVADTPAFAESLLSTAQRFAEVSEIFAYSLVEGFAPQPLLSSSEVGGCAERAGIYTRRFHHHDPVAWIRRATPVGQGFAKRVSSDEIASFDYRVICFDRPQFAEKLCFGWHGRIHSLVLSFYNRSPAATPCLAGLANIGLSVLAARLKHAPVTTPPDVVTRLETHLEQNFPELTPRERAVCARTQAGWSAKKIARDLGICAATVLTYRQRAYQRFGFSSAHDFLDRMLD
jgi:DNA-binding CsgD family transcriptional regulator